MFICACLYVGRGVSQALHSEMGVSTLSVTWRDIRGGGVKMTIFSVTYSLKVP